MTLPPGPGPSHASSSLEPSPRPRRGAWLAALAGLALPVLPTALLLSGLACDGDAAMARAVDEPAAVATAA
ncbi:MAG TPA: hypothetical protein VGB85_01345, partial [Nannocystis sp.]